MNSASVYTFLLDPRCCFSKTMRLTRIFLCTAHKSHATKNIHKFTTFAQQTILEHPDNSHLPYSCYLYNFFPFHREESVQLEHSWGATEERSVSETNYSPPSELIFGNLQWVHFFVSDRAANDSSSTQSAATCKRRPRPHQTNKKTLRLVSDSGTVVISDLQIVRRL